MPYHLDDPKFTVAGVAKAIGVPVNTLRGWLQRGHLMVSEKDRAVAKAGETRLLTLRSALHFAIAVDLIVMGVDHKDASSAASAFAYFGDAERDPGELYKGGATILLHVPSTTNGHVVKAAPDMPWHVLFTHAERFAGVRTGSLRVVKCNDVVAGVRAGLGAE